MAMRMRTDSVTILGARGSAPVSGEQYRKYGGATTCFLIETGSCPIVIDAGTGLMNLPERVLRRDQLSLFLTHTHADHIMGFPICKYVLSRDKRLDVYAAHRGSMTAREQVGCLMSPPLWPVGPELMPSDIHFHDLASMMFLKDYVIYSIDGIHPGEVSLFRIEANNKSVVIATDCTFKSDFSQTFEDFARNCDLLLCDGQYTEDEYRPRESFGHSSWNMAAETAKRCGAKKLLIVHHDPYHTDDELNAASDELHLLEPNFDFAVEGQVIYL